MEKFRTIPNMMIVWVEIDELIGVALDLELPEEAQKLREESASLGKEIRGMLRELGFEEDCEIDSHMEMLARDASKAKDKLSWYIYKNSPKAAEDNEKIGLTRIRDYQDKNSSPIRPDRKH